MTGKLHLNSTFSDKWITKTNRYTSLNKNTCGALVFFSNCECLEEKLALLKMSNVRWGYYNVQGNKPDTLKLCTLLAILVMKDLMSSCVGQLFWQGASAHFRHLKNTRTNYALFLHVTYHVRIYV